MKKPFLTILKVFAGVFIAIFLLSLPLFWRQRYGLLALFQTYVVKPIAGGCRPSRSKSLMIVFSSVATREDKMRALLFLNDQVNQNLDDNVFVLDSYSPDAVPLVRRLPYVSSAENPFNQCMF